jgi:outer membrane protein assembly factor BamB/tetratricopeptide (TPR) repeat protein
MNLQNADTILARSTESRKYTTTDAMLSLAASDTNDLIVTGGSSKDGKGIIHCLGHDGEMKWSQSYPTPITAVGVAAKGALICIGGEGRAVYMSTAFGQLTWQDDCRSELKALAISGSGRFTVVGLADGNINLYDNDIVASRKFAWKHRFGKPVIEVGINADGTLIVASTEEGELAVFTERGDLVWSKVIEAGVGTFRIAAEGDAVAVASDDGKLRYYSAEVGKNLWTANGVFNDVDMSRKADRVVAACKDGNVYCFDKTGAVLWKYEMGNPGENVRIAKEGKTVVASSIDAVVHCLDARGNLLWKHRTGGSGVVGLVLSESGDMVVASCEGGLLYFENIQVVGGLLPLARHEMTLAKERGVPTFKAEKIYEEAVVALNYGDYITAAAKIREMEKALGPVQKPAPSPEAVVPAAGPKPSDEAGAIRTRIDNILAESEELKKIGLDVEPVENLLGEAMVLLEDGNLSDSAAYVQDAREMLDTVRSEAPPPKPAVAPPKPKEGKDDAVKAVEKAATMLAELEETDISLDAARGDIKTARDLIKSADYQRAQAAANRAVVTIEKALDPYITDCLMDVQKLIKTAEKGGIKVDETKKKLGKVRDQIKASDYLGALGTVTEVEDWLEDALEEKRKAQPPKPVEAKPAVATTPPKEGGLDALKAEMGTRSKKPDDVAPPKPFIDVSKVPLGKVDPKKALADADDALRTGDLARSVELFMQVAETAEGRARAIVEGAITMAKDRVEAVQKEGFDVTEPNGLIDGAWADLNAGNYTAAVPKAVQAFEKADTAAAAEIQNIIAESRKALEMALKIGANIQAAEDLINNAEAAMKKREYKVATDCAEKGVAEVEKASNSTVSKIVSEGRAFLDKASAMGADVKDVRALFDEADKALEARVFIKAHELAKTAVGSAQELPKKYVTGKLNEARTKVVQVEKIGADTMMAKNFLIRARSSLGANDLDGALKAVEKCLEEMAKAPKELVNRRIAVARTDIEGVKAEGQATAEIEAAIGQAEAKATEENFEEALKLVDGALAKLKDIRQLGNEATNLLVDVDLAISAARDAGKEKGLIDKAEDMLNKAIEVKAKDPAKSKEMALEIKKMLEG